MMSTADWRVAQAIWWRDAVAQALLPASGEAPPANGDSGTPAPRGSPSLEVT